MAVDALHPDAGSVVELGGQDAKIIIFTEDASGGKRAIASMNDKCASGTGATIDKCLIKVGMPRDEIRRPALGPVAAASRRRQVRRLRRDRHRQPGQVRHPVERDHVLAGRRDRGAEPVGADAREHAEAEGPAARRTERLPAVPAGVLAPADSRDLAARAASDYPLDVPIDQLIIVPDERAVLRGLRRGALRPARAGRRRPVTAGSIRSRQFVDGGRTRAARGVSRPGRSRPSRTSSRRSAARTRSRASCPRPSSRARACAPSIGLDGGSTSSKAVLIDEDGRLLTKQYQLSKGNPIDDTKQLLAKMRAFVHDQGATLEVIGFGATGYAADVLEESLRADVNIVETVAHMMAAVKFFGDVDVICDIGGQDIKVLFMANGEHPEFPAVEPVLRRQRHAAAGDGRPVRRAGHRLRGRRLPGRADAEVQLRLRGVPRRRPRQLPERGLRQGGAAGGPGDGAAEERLAVRRADPAHGGARPPLRAPGRHAVQPRRREGAGRLHQGARARRGGPRASASRRSRRDRRGARDAARRDAPRPLDVRRARRRDRSRVYVTRNDESTRCHFCPNNCAPHVHRRPHARRRHQPLHLRVSAARRARSSRSRR